MGFRETQNQNYKTSWEQVQRLNFAILQPHLTKENENATPQELLPLPWLQSITTQPKPLKENVKQTFNEWDKLKFK